MSLFCSTGVLVNSTSTSTSRRLQNANGRGGAIETYGDTTVTGCTFDNCTAALGGGAIYVGGGSAEISGSTFRRNKSFEGGAIFVESGSVSVSDSDFEENTATNTLTSGDIFSRAGADVSACGNTGAFDDACSGVSGRALVWSLLTGVVAAATLFG